MRRAATQLKTQLTANFSSGGGQAGPSISNTGSGIGLDNNELRRLLISKVDKIDLDRVIEMKSNRTDTEQAIRAIEVLHKQVSHIIVLLIEMMKISTQSSQSPIENQKTKM